MTDSYGKMSKKLPEKEKFKFSKSDSLGAINGQ